MGLQDLLAVVLGVKTAEHLEQRAARPSVDERAQEILRESDARSAAHQVELEARISQRMPDWTAQTQPLIDRLQGIPGITQTTPLAFGAIHIQELYAAYLSGGDYATFCEAFGEFSVPSQKSPERFQHALELLSEIQSKDPSLFDELIDAYLDSPLEGDGLREMCSDLGLPAPMRLPTVKPCPRCAEMVKRQAQVCRFCGHEFVSSVPTQG